MLDCISLSKQDRALGNPGVLSFLFTMSEQANSKNSIALWITFMQVYLISTGVGHSLYTFRRNFLYFVY